MENHYATDHLIHQVNHNYNDQTVLSQHLEWRTLETAEPDDIETLVPRLNDIFNAGGSIILETSQGFDDDGGNCYQAYIVEKKNAKHFQEYWDDNYEKDDTPRYQHCIFEYIVKYPENLMVLWAGPY